MQKLGTPHHAGSWERTCVLCTCSSVPKQTATQERSSNLEVALPPARTRTKSQEQSTQAGVIFTRGCDIMNEGRLFGLQVEGLKKEDADETSARTSKSSACKGCRLLPLYTSSVAKPNTTIDQMYLSTLLVCNFQSLHKYGLHLSVLSHSCLQCCSGR